MLMFSAATVAYQGHDPRGNRRRLLVVRGCCGTLGISLWYTALMLLPLTDVVVFGFLTPLVVALASPVVVREIPSKCTFPHPFPIPIPTAVSPASRGGAKHALTRFWRNTSRQRLALGER